MEQIIQPSEVIRAKQQLESSISVLAKKEYPVVKNQSRFKGVVNPFVYLRLIIIASFLGIQNKYELSVQDLQALIYDKMMNSVSTRVMVVAILMIIDEIQYRVILKTNVAIPNSAIKLTVDVLKRLLQNLTKASVTDDIIYEAFYIVSLSNNQINLKDIEYRFEKLSLSEKQKYVKIAISHVVAMSTSIESSYYVAEELGIYKSYDLARTFYLGYKFTRKMQVIKNEITSARFTNLITEKIKTKAIRMLSLITSNKLRAFYRAVFDLLLGPLVVSLLVDTSKQIDQAGTFDPRNFL